MKTKYLIIPAVILIMFYISSCCGHPDKDSIELKFVDINGKNIFFNTVNYNIDSLSIVNSDNNQQVKHSISLDTSIIIYDIENEFYPNNDYGSESTKELCIYFSSNEIDTIICILLINLEGYCKYDRLKYAEIEYNNIIYTGNIDNGIGYFEIEKNINR